MEKLEKNTGLAGTEKSSRCSGTAKRGRSGLVAKVAGTAAAIATAVGVVAGSYANAGVISIGNFDRNKIYQGSESYYGNIEGGQEGADEYDREFTSGAELEVYSHEPGFKADGNAKPINTFGWLFNLAAKTPITGADNYIELKVDDPTDISRLVAYDLANPSVVYDISLDGTPKIIPLVSSKGGTIPEGEYANWRVDIVKTPGDANLDGTVDKQDAVILAKNWLKTGPEYGWETADFNGDHTVDDLDLAILAANWQRESPSNSIPEPSTGLLASLGIGITALASYLSGKFRK